MQSRTSTCRTAMTTLATAAVVLATQAVQACEGCKQSVGMGDGAGGSRSVNLIGLGYGISIILLLTMVASILMGLGYMMYKNCQIIAAKQRAMLAREEAEDFGSSLPNGSHA